MFPALDRLVDAYRQIQPRMLTLPMYNGRLEVEAVGFEPRDGRLCGVLVTPWFMNLVLLAGEQDDWSGLAPGTTFNLAFPAGEQACMLSAPEGIDPHLSLTLFTTVLDFADQDMARHVARDVLQRLHQGPEPIDADLPQPRSRREFLRSWLPIEEN